MPLMHAAKDDWDQITKDRYSGRAVPTWAPDDDIKVHKRMLAQFDSLVAPPEVQGGKGDAATAAAAGPPLLDVMTFLTGVRPAPARPSPPAVGDCMHALGSVMRRSMTSSSAPGHAPPARRAGTLLRSAGPLGAWGGRVDFGRLRGWRIWGVFLSGI